MAAQHGEVARALGADRDLLLAVGHLARR
jgi:hypothetical protein